MFFFPEDLDEDTDEKLYVLPITMTVGVAGIAELQQVTLPPGFGTDHRLNLFLRVIDMSGAENMCSIGNVQVSIDTLLTFAMVFFQLLKFHSTK